MAGPRHGNHFQAFRYVSYITIIITIVLVIIDPFSTKLSPGTNTSPWLSKWYSIALLGLLFFIGACGRGRIAWATLVAFIMIAGFIHMWLYFVNKYSTN